MGGWVAVEVGDWPRSDQSLDGCVMNGVVDRGKVGAWRWTKEKLMGAMGGPMDE